MFTTYQGARNRARDLLRYLRPCGFNIQLHECQNAIASAAGRLHWHDLKAQFRQGQRIDPQDPERFASRLLIAMPQPCRQAVDAWIGGASVEKGSDTNFLWFTHTFPYVLASIPLHRSLTRSIRPGSGTGQKLRENLVLGLLLNLYGGPFIKATLNPSSLVLSYRGTLEEVFRVDAAHPRFQIELDRLILEGIIELRPNKVSINPPDRDLVLQWVIENEISKAANFNEHDQAAAVAPLTHALRAIGIGNAEKLAYEIIHGSRDHITPSGPVLTRMSELAEAGEIERMAQLVNVVAVIRPENREFIRASVPAKITSRYLARHRKLNIRQFSAYEKRHPDWAETLRNSIDDPARFADAVQAMAKAMSEA